MSEHSEQLRTPWTREADVGVIRDASGEVIIAYGTHPRERDKALGMLLDAAPELVAVLIEYERIEAEIIFDDECWDAELPQHYYDRLIDLQHQRNAALEKAGYSLEMRAKATKGEGGDS